MDVGGAGYNLICVHSTTYCNKGGAEVLTEENTNQPHSSQARESQLQGVGLATLNDIICGKS